MSIVTDRRIGIWTGTGVGNLDDPIILPRGICSSEKDNLRVVGGADKERFRADIVCFGDF